MQNKEEEKQPGKPEATFRLCCSCCEGRYFEIYVSGHLSEVWADWFEGFKIESLENGQTVLAGCVADQAALMGILNKINRLNLTLHGIRECEGEQ